MSFNKKRRPDELNAHADRTLDVATVNHKAVFDGVAVQNKALESGGVLPAASAHAMQVRDGDILFSVANDKSQVPRVQKAINGHEAPFAKYYRNDPYAITMATKASIVPRGLAAEPVTAQPGNLQPEIAVKIAGLQTVHVQDIKAGTRVVYDFPKFAGNVEANTSRGGAADAQNTYTLILRSHDEATLGHEFNNAASRLIHDSLTWEQALAGYYGKAQPTIGAVMADYRHCTAALVLGVSLLLKQGLLTVPGRPLADAVRTRAPDELTADYGAPEMTSYEVAARIAQFMDLTAPSNPIPLSLDATTEWAEVARTFAETLYYSNAPLNGTLNAAVEFGASLRATGPQHDGRFPDGAVKEDRIGAMLNVQVSHTSQAVAAFSQVVDSVDLWTAGWALSTTQDARGLIMVGK